MRALDENNPADGLPVEAHYLEDWPLRPWVLAGLGAMAGLGVHLILESDGEAAWGAGLAAFLFFAFIAASLVLRPTRLVESAVFALGLGVVLGAVAWIASAGSDNRAGTEFAFAAGIFFAILAIPLFQAGFHRRKWATPYAETHFHVWTDAVSGGGAIAFVGLSWLVLWLLHALFSIVGIEAIEALIDTEGFAGAFMGATFGGAMGVLRNQLGILGTLQRVVMLVFALLAVPFAAALLVFLVILLFSGGNALWEATDAATPVLLACAVAAFVLANSIIRDDDAARSGNVVMQAAALVLAFCIFPLTVFAAISMGIRIDQHGLSPERIWALVAIVIATAYGLAYWIGLARGRMSGWSEHLRVTNLRLAVASCAVALILAFPLVDFGAMSASNQIARLERGEVTVEEFDFDALKWDFGDAGREALAGLARSANSRIADLATVAMRQEQRPWDQAPDRLRTDAEINLQVQPEDPEIRRFMLAQLRYDTYECTEYCVAIDVGTNAEGEREIALIEGGRFRIYRMTGEPPAPPEPMRETGGPRYGELKEGSEIEIRTYEQRYIVIDGKPLRQSLDEIPREMPPE